MKVRIIAAVGLGAATRLVPAIIVCLLLILPTGDPTDARNLGSRLGGAGAGSAAPPADGGNVTPAAGFGLTGVQLTEAMPEALGVLSPYGPMAADGAGRLLVVVGAADGYAVLRGAPPHQIFELIYRRKGAIGTAITVASDGAFCVGLTTGVDCIDAAGRIEHYEHPLLTNVLGLAFTSDGALWVLRGSGGAVGLQLVRARRPIEHGDDVKPILTFRQTIQGFAGNGIAPASDGGVFLAVIENDTLRVIHVDGDGRLTRRANLWRPGGAIAVGRGDVVFVTGVKRPQSLEEQRNPVDVLYSVLDETTGFAARFPAVPRGFTSHMTEYAALGGDGMLYLVRREPVRNDEGPAREQPVLWRVPSPVPSNLGPDARVIDFRIPFIQDVVNPRFLHPDYVGPILVARGQPLRITGLNFDGKQGLHRVIVGGIPAPIQSWSENLIDIVLPAAAPAGEARVQAAIDDVVSDHEFIEVKTPNVPGWFQVGNPGMKQALQNNLGIVGYNAYVTIDGVTEAGTAIRQVEYMDTPGLLHLRLPNGTYTATFVAAYVVSQVHYGANFDYAGSSHTPVQVPEQVAEFAITDEEPIVLWLPEMLVSDK